MYIDKILTLVVANDLHRLNIQNRDIRVLNNLAKSVQTSSFITENQGRLLIRILKTYTNVLKIDMSFLENPTWSKELRIVEKKKTVYISANDASLIVIEFTFSSSLRKSILNLSKHLTNLQSPNSNQSMFYVDLTESNIVVLVDELSTLGFIFDEKITEYYNTIKSWSLDDFINQYQISTITNQNFKKHLTNDLGINTPLNDDVITDRSIRYQYYVKTPSVDTTNLASIIANRSQPRVWIDKNKYQLSEVVKSLKELKRLPLLIVFETRDPKKCADSLEELSNILDENNINDVGIYFRLSNNTLNGTVFNQLIADKMYNQTLTPTTTVVGVDTTKIPKFFLTSDWRPMSVISIDHSLKNSKTAIYTNCCDLVIAYTSSEPLIEPRNVWE